jgi:hypothetical protein
MSGLLIVSGIALSMGQPVPSSLSLSVPSPQISVSKNVPAIPDQNARSTPVQLAGLSDWFLQLFSPKKIESNRGVVIDRPYRF